MALRTFTPSPDLPEALTEAINLGQTRISALEGERTRLTNIVSELKTELISLEHDITGAQEALKTSQDAKMAIDTQVIAQAALIEGFGPRIEAGEATIRANGESIKAQAEEKAVLTDAILNLRVDKKFLTDFIDKEEAKIVAKKKIIDDLIVYAKSTIDSI